MIGIGFQTVGAFIAIMALAIMFNVPNKTIVYVGFIGATGWLIYLIVTENGGSLYFGDFAASLLICMEAEIGARLYKMPVTSFEVPAIMVLVPGAGMYRMVYALIIGDMDKWSFYSRETLQAAGVIALGMFFVGTIASLPVSWRRNKAKREALK